MRQAALVEQDIGRLQVAVQNPALVGMMDGLGDDGDQPGGRAGIGGELGEPLVEAASRDQLHAEEMPPSVLANLVNRHDVRMVELCDSLGLVLKSHQLGFGGERARLDHLEGDRPVERDLVSLEDDAHPASPQLAQDLVARHALAREAPPA